MREASSRALAIQRATLTPGLLALVATVGFFSPSASQPDDAHSTAPLSVQAHPAVIGSIDHTHVFTASEVRSDVDSSKTALLRTISVWLAENFNLPQIGEVPRLALGPPLGADGMRDTRVLPLQPQDAPSGPRTAVDVGEQIIAFYDDATQTIFLPNGWTGVSRAEQSILVHEMVHHLQNRARLKYSCAQEREKLAFEAQERWLARFGTSLQIEFQIDPFTLFVRVNCAF
jgi:hypothetical protein